MMIDLQTIFFATAVILMATAILVGYRAIIGPTIGDRLVAISVFGTTTLVVLVLVGYVYNQPIFVDISLVYAMLNFVVAVAAGRYLQTGGIFG
ncbi:hypothetical protein C9439_06395 [archaeon SCG-AAA382B04]|nr:hypothetical protein C9439_06395 [archaeon SCG-AAA382B04]